MDDRADHRSDRRRDEVDPQVAELGAHQRRRERPGRLTEAPLKGIAARWIATSVSGIASRALPKTRCERVDWRMTATKTADSTSSSQNASQVFDAVVAVETDACLERDRNGHRPAHAADELRDPVADHVVRRHPAGEHERQRHRSG